MFKLVLLIGSILLIGLTGLYLLVIGIGYVVSIPKETSHEQLKKISASANWKDNSFQNIDPSPKKLISVKNIFKFITRRDRAKWPKWVTINPKHVPDTQLKHNHHIVQFINHATVLIKLGDLTILTDPMFSKRCSPFWFMGPKRVHHPGVLCENLPKIDVVLISHNHYDHLDIPSLKKLQEKDNPLIVTGLGLAQFFKTHQLDNIQLLDWWQSLSLKSNQITFVPAQHFSSRGLFDKNKALWGGFVVENKKLNKRLYFAGDTGYGRFVEHIQKAYPDGFDLALIPIGAYLPQDIMQPVHINPTEAFNIHQHLNSKKSIGIHWGTFQLTNEARNDPVKQIERLKKQALDTRFIVLEPGSWESF